MTNTNHSIPKGQSDEHYTPKSLFDALGIEFDLDVCAPHNGTNATASKWLCKCCNDGLLAQWHGNVWMNPPYSSPTEWVNKFVNHGHGIALLPITRGKWWDGIWDRADAILPLTYNYKFERPDGMVSKPIVFRTALYAIGQTNAEALHRHGGGARKMNNSQPVDNSHYVKWIMALTCTFVKKLSTYLTRWLRFTRAGEPLAVSSKARRNAFGLSLCLAAISMQTMPLNAATSSDYYKLYLHSKVIDFKQYKCAIEIGDRESHWNPFAVNGNHYGIFQMNNKKVKYMNPFTQIDWWIKYIKNRYHGSYCTALEHLKKRGWQ